MKTEKLAEIYFILEKLERQDLMDFMEDDSDYETEDDISSEEEDESDLSSEHIQVSQSPDGFYKIVDVKLK